MTCISSGNTGSALAFVNEKNSNILRELRELLEENEQESPAWLNQMVQYSGMGGGGRGGGGRGRGRRGGGGGGSNFGSRDVRYSNSGGAGGGGGGALFLALLHA